MEKQYGNREQWNHSYNIGGNICFYPHEKIIRFVNKYVRKKVGINKFQNIMDLTEEEWRSFKSLDLGCGIGRHVNFLDDFELNPYGIDLSDTAVSIGKEWFRNIGKEELADRLIVGSVADLPFENDSFWICVSAGVLDSMKREIAFNGIRETLRVLKKNGLMYLDLVMDSKIGDKDEFVEDGIEKDTIQSYFTVDSIKKFLGESVKIIEFKMISWSDINYVEENRRAHIIIQKI